MQMCTCEHEALLVVCYLLSCNILQSQTDQLLLATPLENQPMLQQLGCQTKTLHDPQAPALHFHQPNYFE
jgi:hypothetical protein